MTDQKTLAASILLLLQQDPRRYKNFGVFWYLIKALLKKHYTRDNLYLLGENFDQSVIERMPDFDALEDALAAATDEYGINTRFNLNRSEVVDHAGGGTIDIIDSDAGF